MTNAQNSAVILLVKFFIPQHRDDLVPYGFELIEEMPNTNKHFNKLKRLGLAELAEVGRVRPGKQDSGNLIAEMEMASAPSFLEMMKKQGLAILSAKRFLEPERTARKGKDAPKQRFVLTLGIGFADEGITFKKSDWQAIERLFQNTWQYCYVWNNSAPRDGGVATVDTVNFAGCMDKGTKWTYALIVKDGTEADSIDLDWSPFNPTAKPLSLQSGAPAAA